LITDSVQSCELGQFNGIVHKTHKDIELMEILLSSNFNTLGKIFQITVGNMYNWGGVEISFVEDVVQFVLYSSLMPFPFRDYMLILRAKED